MDGFLRTAAFILAGLFLLTVAAGITVLVSLKGKGVIGPEQFRELVLTKEERAWLVKMGEQAEEPAEKKAPTTVVIERVPEDFRRRPLTRALPRTIQDANERVETLERGLRLLEGLTDAPPSTEVFDDDVDAIFEALIEDDARAANLLEAPVPGFEAGIAGVGGWTAPGLRVAFK